MDTRLSVFFTKAIGILLLSVIVGGLVFGIIMFVRSMIKLKKQSPKSVKYGFLIILCVFIAAASWIFNMGWIRLIFTLFAFPVVYTAFFLIVNSKALPRLLFSVKLKIYTLLSCATYLLSFLFLPDGGDYGPMYVLFGLIRNDIFVDISYILCEISFAAFVLVSVFQIKEIVKVWKSENAQTEIK